MVVGQWEGGNAPRRRDPGEGHPRGVAGRRRVPTRDHARGCYRASGVTPHNNGDVGKAEDGEAQRRGEGRGGEGAIAREVSFTTI